MRISRGLLMPAAAEVRQMLHRIKLDNAARSAQIGGKIQNSAHEAAFFLAEPDTFVYSAAEAQHQRQQQQQRRHRDLQQEHAKRMRTFSDGDSLFARAGRAAQEMGSFTSMPKVIPAASECDCDADVTYPPPDAREELPEFLARCSRHLTSLPPPIQRKWINNSNNINNSSSTNSSSSNDDERSSVINEDNNASESGEKIRVLQWNVLSQALGTKNDNFVQCPASALRWQTRRFRMLEEVARHDADVVCLQEVDHFEFLRKSLSALGYEGRFFPKPDSPCLYLDENTGPDGCAIFWKADRFEMTRSESRVIEVWSVESNQVVLTTTLRSRADPSVRLCVATTHLKARNGALLSTLRNEQGKDIVQFLADNVEAEDEDAAVILTGDFNAEPTEPVFTTVTDSKLGLDSAYTPDTYTTWKIREDGEHKQTLDYIFYSRDRMSVEAVLEMPSGEDIGGARLPSAAFASDHLSLVADLRLRKKTKTEDEAAEN